MDAYGCNGGYAHGGEQKQGKKSPEWVSRTCFWVHDQGKKMLHIDNNDYGEWRGSRGGTKGK